jgi:hypothetical protein
MKAGTIGLWQYLHLVKVGTTTTIFSQDLRGRDFLKVNSILLIMDSSFYPSSDWFVNFDQFQPGLKIKRPEHKGIILS